MNNVWVASDWHLWTKNLNGRHPFVSTAKIDQLISNYTEVIQPTDIFIYLGDLCDLEVADIKKLQAFISSIPGYKILCKGDHDTEIPEFYLNLGFNDVCDICKIHSIIFSHMPVKVAPDMINIHGDSHSRKQSNLGYQHICVYDKDETMYPSLVDDLLQNPPNTNPEKYGASTEDQEQNIFRTYHDDALVNIIDISSKVDLYPMDEVAAQSNVYAAMDLNELQTPQDLYEWMRKNIHYGNYTKLKTDVQLLKSHSGSCHDQVYFAYPRLRQMGVNPKILFFVEYKEGQSKGGMTHTLIYWKDEHSDKVMWFENAWNGQQGIHEFDSFDSLKKYIEDEHDRMSSSKNFPNLYFKTAPFNRFKAGMTLQELVKAIMEGDELDESTEIVYGDIILESISGDGFKSREMSPEFAMLVETARMEVENDPIDEIIFDDIESTKYWLSDDDVEESAITEASAITDEQMRDIMDFNTRLNGFKYGLAIDGVIDTKRNTSGMDYVDYYHFANPEQFEKQQGGICWDYATYEAQWLKTHYPKIKYTAWYIIFDYGPVYPTHTFLTLKHGSRVVYLESSFKLINGIWVAPTEKDIINFIMKSMSDHAPKDIPTSLLAMPYRVYAYDPLDPKLHGMSDGEFMAHIEKTGKLVKHRYSNTFEVSRYVEINESKIEFVNDEGKEVPKVCPDCGSKVGVFLQGEPVFLCTNKKCKKYFGTVPCNLDESYTREEDQIEFNVERWAPGGNHNVMYITGLSGSGKTTLGQKLAKEHDATYVNLDHFMSVCRKGPEHLAKKKRENDWSDLELMELYFKAHPEGYIPNGTSFNSLSDISRDIVGEYYLKYNNWLRITLHNGKFQDELFVVEGVHIYEFESAELYEHEPVIVKSPSVLTTLIRREKRGLGMAKEKYPDITNLELILGTVKDTVNFAIPMYIKQAPKINKFRSDLIRMNEDAAHKQTTNVLYHGSSSKHSVILANSPAGNRNCTYGTPNYNFALAYAGKQWNDLDINQSMVNNVMVLTEIVPGAFNDIFSRGGYIHYLPSDDFEQFGSHKYEYVCPHDVKPIKVEHVSNVLKVLKERSDVKLYYYPDLPDFIKSRAEYVQRVCNNNNLRYDLCVKLLIKKGATDLSNDGLSEAASEAKPDGYKSLNSFKHKVCDEGELVHWKEKFPEELSRLDPDVNTTVTLWMTKDESKMVAYIALEQKGNQTIMQTLGVFPEYRSYGLDKQLMKYAKINGATLLYVNPSNKTAVNLYKSCGWKYAGWKNRGMVQPMVLDEAATKTDSGLKVTTKNTTNPNDSVSTKAVALNFYDGKDHIGEVYISAVDTKEGFIYNLEVFKKYRGKGYGRKIMEYVLDNYDATDLTVDPDNEIAIKLYKSLGFKFKRKIKDPTDGAEVLWFHRNLTRSVNEAAAQLQGYDRKQQEDVSKKYGIKAVGHDTPDDTPEKRVDQRREKQLKNLKKARKVKKRKAFVRKIKSKLPGNHNKKNEDVDISDIPVNQGEKNFFDRSVAAFDFENETGYKFAMAENIKFIDAINESSSADNKLYPVYIMLMHSGTALATAIKTITQSHFSHSSISFDSSMKSMYSFGRKMDTNPFIGSFKKENIHDDFFKGKSIPYALYVVPCTKDEIGLMKKRLDYFIKNATKFHYDFTGLFKNYLGIADNPEYKWFCSRFVADILNAGRPSSDPYVVEPSLMKPEDFLYTNFAIYATGGLLDAYDQDRVDAITRRILRVEEIKRRKEKQIVQNEAVDVFDLDPFDPLQEAVLSYHLSALSENAFGDFMNYLKSFKVRFDKNGNVIITRREYDQLDKHFRQSIRMLKAYEKANDVESVKEELCKIYYMIGLINQHYLNPANKQNKTVKSDIRKEMMDLRSVMMNVFQQHLTYVTNQDPKFNFQQYYNHSKYSSTVEIPNTVISAVGKALVTGLK